VKRMEPKLNFLRDVKRAQVIVEWRRPIPQSKSGKESRERNDATGEEIQPPNSRKDAEGSLNAPRSLLLILASAFFLVALTF